MDRVLVFSGIFSWRKLRNVSKSRHFIIIFPPNFSLCDRKENKTFAIKTNSNIYEGDKIHYSFGKCISIPHPCPPKRKSQREKDGNKTNKSRKVKAAAVSH